MKKVIFLLTVALSSNAFALKGVPSITLESVDDYTVCQERVGNVEACNFALEDWVKAHPKDAFKAAKLARRHNRDWYAVPLFAKAFEAKVGQCQDEDLQRSVKSALGLPEDYKQVAPAKKIAFTYCAKELRSALESLPSEGSYEKRNVCPELTTQRWNTSACEK